MTFTRKTTETISAHDCDIDLSFNRIKVTNTATKDSLVIDNIDWRKLHKAFGEYYTCHGTCSVGIDWFKDSTNHWNLEDLKALGSAVQAAIASKEVAQEYES
jgi:hypothetical protein